MLNVNFEGNRVDGALEEKGIILTIKPDGYDDQVEAEVLSAISELLAFYQFKNTQTKATKPILKENRKCEKKKAIEVKDIEKEPVTNNSAKVADVVITEGPYQGKTFQAAYDAEGIRCIEFLSNHAKDEAMKATASQFISELEG